MPVACNEHFEYQDMKPACLIFKRLVSLAEKLLLEDKYLQSYVISEIAAIYASYNHNGQFVSLDLEKILMSIGRYLSIGKIIDHSKRKENYPIKKVLHVLTAGKNIGGDSRFVWRLIRRDSDRLHSVALTSQKYFDIPEDLSKAVAASGGNLYILDQLSDDVLQRTQILRRISKDVDVVFLHIYVNDVLPLVAYADRTDLPPIVFVVQADHQFWVGASISDLFVHMRESGELLSKNRRGVAMDRSAFLPIPLDMVTRKNSRSEAKRNIGLSEDTILLLSIAQAVKYTPIKDPPFAELLAPIVNKYTNVVLLVIGPDISDQWEKAFEETHGKIRALGSRSDTRIFYEAADIYLDSFPFASNTSLLEAGSYGIPLVTYFPFSHESEVLGAGAPGLKNSLLCARCLNEYEKTVTRLIDDRVFRESIGERTKQEIMVNHCGQDWNGYLNDLFDKISKTPLSDRPCNTDIGDDVGELDWLLNKFYSKHISLGWAIYSHAHHLPYVVRIKLLLDLIKINRDFSFAMFFPDWLGIKMSRYLKGWRKLPLVNRLFH